MCSCCCCPARSVATHESDKAFMYWYCFVVEHMATYRQHVCSVAEHALCSATACSLQQVHAAPTTATIMERDQPQPLVLHVIQCVWRLWLLLLCHCRNSAAAAAGSASVSSRRDSFVCEHPAAVCCIVLAISMQAGSEISSCHILRITASLAQLNSSRLSLHRTEQLLQQTPEWTNRLIEPITAAA